MVHGLALAHSHPQGPRGVIDRVGLRVEGPLAHRHAVQLVVAKAPHVVPFLDGAQVDPEVAEHQRREVEARGLPCAVVELVSVFSDSQQLLSDLGVVDRRAVFRFGVVEVEDAESQGGACLIQAVEQVHAQLFLQQAAGHGHVEGRVVRYKVHLRALERRQQGPRACFAAKERPPAAVMVGNHHGRRPCNSRGGLSLARERNTDTAGGQKPRLNQIGLGIEADPDLVGGEEHCGGFLRLEPEQPEGRGAPRAADTGAMSGGSLPAAPALPPWAGTR